MVALTFLLIVPSKPVLGVLIGTLFTPAVR